MKLDAGMESLLSRVALLENSVLQVMSHTEEVLDVTKRRGIDSSHAHNAINTKVQDLEEKVQKHQE